MKIIEIPRVRSSETRDTTKPVGYVVYRKRMFSFDDDDNAVM